MLHKIAARWWRISMGLLLALLPASAVFAEVVQPSQSSWINPSEPALKQLFSSSTLDSSQPNFQTNLDCSQLTYRFLGDLTKTMHTGCFSMTAFGLLDADHSIVIPNGFSEALPIRGQGNSVLTPLPNSEVMGSLSNASVRGSYLRLYTYFLSAFGLQFDSTLQPYFQVTQSPNITLSDAAGQPLAINPQTMAYSSRGSWLVTEAPTHSFVRVNTDTLDIMPFAPSFTVDASYDYAQHNSQVAVSDDGNVVAIESNEFDTFKLYDLTNCIGTSTNLSAPSCASHDYWDYVHDHIPGLVGISHVRFMNDDLLSFNATTDTGKTSTYLLSYKKITNLLDYLALGDSYSSGEGAFDYLTGTDTSNDVCHLSSRSYPLLLIKDLFTSSSGHSVACSGATMEDLGDTTDAYSGQVHDGILLKDRKKNGSYNQILDSFTPGYLAQYEFAKKYQPKILTVGIGGNDIDFAGIIAKCVQPHVGNNDCYSSQEDRQELMDLIDRTEPTWVQLYQQLHSVSKSTQIYAIGYPHIAKPDGDCGDNVHLSNEEIKFSEALIDYLNGAIEEAANEASVTYIDISHALDGHRLCEATAASVAMNGLTAGGDIGHVLGNESFHPNALGHELIEQAILGQTHHFASIGSSTSIDKVSSSQKLLTAPKSGRKIRHVQSDTTITSRLVTRSKSAHLSVHGAAHSLKSNTGYQVSLDGSMPLGTFVTDGTGEGTADIVIPASVDPGVHSVDIDGQDLTGGDTTVDETIYVNADDNDMDGDGVANTVDSCPDIINSGHDLDQDGIDDACDAVIAAPMAGMTNGSTPGPQSINNSPNNTVSSAGDSSSKTTLTSGSGMSTDSLPITTVALGQLASAIAAPLWSGNGPITAHTAGAVLGAKTITPSLGSPGISGTQERHYQNLHYVPFWYFEDAGLMLLLLIGLNTLSERLERARTA